MEPEKESDVLERVRRGEVKGLEALALLEDTGDYVFHGSGERIEEIEPRQAVHEGDLDGPPGVAASSEARFAVFRALVREGLSGWRGRGEDFRFYAEPGVLIRGRSQENRGYVHVFPKSEFTQFRGAEYRKTDAAHPLAIIEVSGEDLPENIEPRSVPKS